MNRRVFQGSLVHQMMASGNPNWWNINNMKPPPHDDDNHHHHQQQAFPTASSLFHDHQDPNFQENSSQEFPESWSQLLMGEEDKYGVTNDFSAKKLENWEDQLVYSTGQVHINIDDQVKQEYCGSEYHSNPHSEEIQASKCAWNQILMSNSSPKSCVTTISSSNMLDFSNNKQERRHQHPTDNSSECNSSAFKKARVQRSTSPQSTFKVTKEKLGDRITALHQLVSPFGKTDTASVLLEVIGYIRFLQSQIEALCSPYLVTAAGNVRQNAQKERTSLFPEDPCQLNTSGMNSKGPQNQECNNEVKNDLRSRGLCLVPLSLTLHVGSENGADYWAPTPTFGGGF